MMPAQSQQYILIVEDDPDAGTVAYDYLSAQGYYVKWVTDGIKMKRCWKQHIPDLVIMDEHLPGEDGLTLIRWILEQNDDTAIIMTSAAGDAIDRVAGLETGADDYLVKPLVFRELLARIRAVFRRCNPSPSKEPKPLQFGPFSLDTQAHILYKNQQEIPLTHAEFQLLNILVQHPNQVLHRSRLLQLLRGYKHEAYDRSIDVCIRRLRLKIETEAAQPEYIRTVRGEGYLFTRNEKS